MTAENVRKFRKDCFPHIGKVWIILLVIWYPIGLFYLIFAGLPRYIMAKKCTDKLAQRGQLDQAIRDFYSGHRKVFCGGAVIFTDDFIFLTKQRKIITYQEVLWAYKVNVKTSVMFIPTGSSLSLNLVTSDFKTLSTAPESASVKMALSDDEAREIVYEVLRHNANCMVGYTPENRERFTAMVKQKR